MRQNRHRVETGPCTFTRNPVCFQQKYKDRLSEILHEISGSRGAPAFGPPTRGFIAPRAVGLKLVSKTKQTKHYDFRGHEVSTIEITMRSRVPGHFMKGFGDTAKKLRAVRIWVKCHFQTTSCSVGDVSWIDLCVALCHATMVVPHVMCPLWLL